MAARLLRVVHLHRRPDVGLHHSIEGYFASVRGALPEEFDVRVRVSRFASTGVWRRLLDVLGARLRRGDIFHVTGDVHFLTYALPRSRTVLTVLDCGLGHAPGVKGAVFRALWLRWPVARSGAVVAISEATAGELAELARVAVERVRVIPISVDDGLVPVPSDGLAARPVVLCFSATPNKNLDRLAEAVRGLDVELHVIGRLSDQQRGWLATSGVAWRNDEALSTSAMRAAYAGCDLVAFPSTYEGFGMPIVEAQAVGRPVVTSARAPMDWVAGDAACLVDPEDVASIRAGIVRVVEDAAYRAELVRRGYDNRERFRPAVAAAMYADLYRELAAAAGRTR